jgi:curved DNA-binding protein CbpA
VAQEIYVRFDRHCAKDCKRSRQPPHPEMDETKKNDIVDCFAVLGLGRAAALDEQTLQRAYSERSRAAHPDHGGSEALAYRVNAAYETLRHPHNRLKHLVELGAPEEARKWRTVALDETMMALFSEIGTVMELTGKFIERKTKASSALAKALLAPEEMRHRESLERVAIEIQDRMNRMEDQLPSLDAALANHQSEAWKQVAEMQARFAYLAKWQAQIRERLLALM